MNEVIIGKRVGIGAAITSLAGAIAHFYPAHAGAIIGLAVPLTFAIQVWWANKYGITVPTVPE